VNLHGLASLAVGAVNPLTSATLKRCMGYGTSANGTRTPVYAEDEAVDVQLQGMGEKELAHMNELNIGGILRTVWTNGTLQALDRKQGTGGDLLITADNTTWLVVHILFQWPEWVSAVVQKQVDA
jgi:hypothetical protein